MLGKIVGAFVGSRLSRNNGSSGLKGAVLGAAGATLARRALPASLAIGGGVLAKRLWDKRQARRNTL